MAHVTKLRRGASRTGWGIPSSGTGQAGGHGHDSREYPPPDPHGHPTPPMYISRALLTALDFMVYTSLTFLRS